MNAGLAPAELLALPAVVDVPTAARALGIGTTLAYELAKAGEFPCSVLRLGRLYRVPRAGLLEVLGVRPDVGETGPATGPAAATAATSPTEARHDHGTTVTALRGA